MTQPSQRTQPQLGVAKITPPQLSDVVPRSALLRRLQKANDRQLIFITGQAAQGKSTLAASYAGQTKEPVAWVNLGPEDSDAANLFYAIAYALSRLRERNFIPASAEQPATTTVLRSEIPLYRGWSVSLFSLAGPPALLILDGLDRLEKGSSSLTFLSVLLEEAPPSFRVMLLSRTLPFRSLAEIKMDRNALLLDNRDLAFTEAEAKALFKKRYASGIEPEAFSRIYQATEGWVGGLVILGESVARLPEEQKRLSVLGGAPQDFHQQIFQYFSDNIFDSFEPKARDILLKTSLFQTIEPKFIKELLEEDQAESVLTDLFNRSIFTTAHYDEDKGIVFRYHKLFHDFLGQKLAASHENREINALLVRAGGLLQDRGDHEEALECYRKARAFAQASLAIKRLGPQLIQQGRHSDLSHWLKSLPRDIVQKDPWLLLFLCWARRLSGFIENLTDLPKVLREFRATADIAGVLYCLSFLIESLLVAGQPWDVIKPALDEAEAILKEPESASFPYEKAVLYYQLSSMHSLRGDPRKGYWAGRESLLIASSLGDLILQLRTFPFVLISLTYLGDYQECDKLITEVDALMKECRHPELQAKYLLAKTMYLIFSGREKSAKSDTKDFVELVEKKGLMIFSSTAFLNRLLCASFFEDFAEMDRQLKFLPSIRWQTVNPFIEAVLLSTAGNGLYRKADCALAGEYLDKAIEFFSSQAGDSEFHLNNARIVKVLVSRGLDQGPDREEVIDRALAYFREMGNQRSASEALLAKAWLGWRRGAEAEAVALLDEGLLLAERSAHWHFLRISRRDAAEICLLGVELASQPAADYAAKLLTGHLSNAIPSQRLEQLTARQDNAIAGRAKEIQRILKRQAAPKIAIKTFGGLQVMKDGAPLAEEEWGGKQPKQLLKAIICHGADKVPKEKLIDCLWPDKEPVAAEKNFKVALHKLRKALEPDLAKGVGSTYLNLKQNLLSLDKELCESDLDLFCHQLERAKKLESDDKEADALALYLRAAELYRGDFLSRDGHKEWLTAHQEDLRLAYLDALLRIAWLLEKGGSRSKAIAWCKKALALDPYNEEICQRLMQLYGAMGKKALALKTYQDFVKALQDDLDAEPDPLTSAIYAKLMSA
jgi:LuxR family maltose regulon positive regulatory protein